MERSTQFNAIYICGAGLWIVLWRALDGFSEVRAKPILLIPFIFVPANFGGQIWIWYGKAQAFDVERDPGLEKRDISQRPT